MSDLDDAQKVSNSDLAVLLGRMSALRTATEIFSLELRKHGLLPTQKEFYDCIDKLDFSHISLSRIASKNPVLQSCHNDDNMKELATHHFHAEIKRVSHDILEP